MTIKILSLFSLCFFSTHVLSNSSNDLSQLLDWEKRVINVYDDVSPSVVNVSNIKVAQSFIYGRVEVPQGSGTGFIWDEQGHIVTNFHVVQGGSSFVITFKGDEKQYKAKVVGEAPNKDIAVLRLEDAGKKKLKPVNLGI
jgi:S1-C subfamily serine protease